jgi:hypothetical protein
MDDILSVLKNTLVNYSAKQENEFHSLQIFSAPFIAKNFIVHVDKMKNFCSLQ